MLLNDNFWDCECKTNYIRTKNLKTCALCGARAEDMPDSRQNEIDDRFKDADSIQIGTQGDYVLWYEHGHCEPFWFSNQDGDELGSSRSVKDLEQQIKDYDKAIHSPNKGNKAGGN